MTGPAAVAADHMLLPLTSVVLTTRPCSWKAIIGFCTTSLDETHLKTSSHVPQQGRSSTELNLALQTDKQANSRQIE